MSTPTLSEVVNIWPTVAQERPRPGAICDWFFIPQPGAVFDEETFKDGYIRHGRGEWQEPIDGLASCSCSPVQLQCGAFSCDGGWAFYDSEQLYWREVVSEVKS